MTTLSWAMALLGIAQQTQTRLPNGWALTPAGHSVQLGDLPLNMDISRDGRYIAVTNNGVSIQSVQLLDATTHKVLFSRTIAKSWYGIKFSGDSKALYVSGGNDNQILKYEVGGDSLRLADSIVLGKKWPEKISPTGLDIEEARNRLYVVTKENNSLYVIDLGNKQVLKCVQLGSEAYTCVLSPDRSKLFISVWGAGKVAIFDMRSQVITDSIAVGRNPNDMCVAANGKYVFVANAVDNSVSVINVKARKVVETLNTALYPNAPDGSTANSVAVSQDGSRLYVANADNNCLAVFDVSKPGHSFSKGFIPVGWYPDCVRVKGSSLLVINGKGMSSAANSKGPQPGGKAGQAQYKKATGGEEYIGSLFKGTLSFIDEPTDAQLGDYTTQVYRNTPYSKAKELATDGEEGNPIPRKVGAPSPIKHVFYVIKENRTYDQVLSDMLGGNGDTSLLLFGKEVTPNEHALAGQFVLLDNFYVDAEVSADGHNWSMAAYANDYVEKTWPTNYGNRGGTYDYAANKKVALPRDGFLWDYALRKGITFRDYGEFTDDDGVVYLKDLKAHMCQAYSGWNLAIKDIEREKIWERDFDSLVAAKAVPQLNIIYLPNDHTAGLVKKSRTPYAYVADNDLALGKLVAHLSNSQVWDSSAVFVLEDDAQNGPDHVDAHRSIAFLAGPYVKRNYADHTMYSTSSMLRTMELILGIGPMSQYDAAAVPMYRCFTATPDNTAYKWLPAQVNIEEINTTSTDTRDDFDLSAPDKVPEAAWNKTMWAALKGDKKYPAPVRAAFVKVNEDEDD